MSWGFFKRSVLIALVLPIGACSWIWPKEKSLEVTVQAADNINPNTQAQASPVVVRVYQLGRDQQFKTIDFFTLYGQEKETLGKALLAREELEILPGDSTKLVTMLLPETRFIGALAALRKIDQAEWRALVAAPKVRKRLEIQVGLDDVKLRLQPR